MATNTGISKPAKAPATKPRLKVGESMPAYGMAEGVRSFRYGLRARERDTIDRALAILGRYLREPGRVFDSPAQVKAYIALQLGAEPCERFAVLYLDSQNRALAFEVMFMGTLTQASVYPREVATAALQHKAAAVLLAHNHPSGSLEPSVADLLLTTALKNTLALVDVRVLDHVIVSGSRALSMAEKGLI